MTPKEMAERLHGREYGSEITKEEAVQAKASGLVVLFGYSDDGVELYGAIREELSAYGGTEIFLTSAGLVRNECDHDDCPYFKRLNASAIKITARWNAEGYCWVFDAPFPHVTFDIMNGVGDSSGKFCRGIVFALADVKA